MGGCGRQWMVADYFVCGRLYLYWPPVFESLVCVFETTRRPDRPKVAAKLFVVLTAVHAGTVLGLSDLKVHLV